MIKLVAMDLDGTLLNGEKGVSEYTAQILRECEAKGVKMVIASGRGFDSARVYARLTGLNSPIVSANGARVEQTPFGPTIMEDCIPEELSREVCRIMLESGIYFVCYCRGVNYSANGTEIKRGLMPKHVVDGGRYAVRNTLSMEELLGEGVKRPYKYVAFTEDYEALARLRRRLETEIDAAISSSWPDNVEVLAKGCGKGKAIGFLAERYGIAKEEIMAFGDQENDRDMLLSAGWPVAMENGTDGIKAIARIIALPNTQDGVGKILEKYVLER
ncbi:MAG: Cof-type HAD-IIB family hydrolase [Eubacteriales bacterium]|nr:Cof-type HAD-IIB family hydrolase [Eubacteriales bacterium]